MVMKPEPLYRAIQAAKGKCQDEEVIFLSPKGPAYTQSTAQELSVKEHLILLCGHYEGIDERIRKNNIDREISIGDYILTGGEIAALIIIDSISRLIPGVIGNHTSLHSESFSDFLLDYPSYTRPEEFMGERVPDVLLSGHHGNIEKWRLVQQLEETARLRPDLFRKYQELHPPQEKKRRHGRTKKPLENLDS